VSPEPISARGAIFREPSRVSGRLSQRVWTLDLFGLPTLTGLNSQAGALAWALAAFTVVGIIVAVLLTMFVRQRLYGAR